MVVCAAAAAVTRPTGGERRGLVQGFRARATVDRVFVHVSSCGFPCTRSCEGFRIRADNRAFVRAPSSGLLYARVVRASVHVLIVTSVFVHESPSGLLCTRRLQGFCARVVFGV